MTRSIVTPPMSLVVSTIQPVPPPPPPQPYPTPAPKPRPKPKPKPRPAPRLRYHAVRSIEPGTILRPAALLHSANPMVPHPVAVPASRTIYMALSSPAMYLKL
ncbi:hypothetical protein F5Y13DRAFT_188626 [Hypoxylon sp. FL1857]|nr:hypothetical protein F5Y13DRAFT_188626 [Hypoxylon sp. FL1857]